MATITFREATLEDKPKLLQFEQQLIAYERPFDSILKEDCTYYDLDTPKLLKLNPIIPLIHILIWVLCM